MPPPSACNPTKAKKSRSRTSLASAFSSFSSPRSEEHTSELQSPCNLVCRLLLEKKNAYHRYLPSCPRAALRDRPGRPITTYLPSVRVRLSLAVHPVVGAAADRPA